MHFLALHAVLLPNLPCMHLQNALFNVTVSYTALLLIKEFKSQTHKKCYKEPLLMEFTGLTMFPTILKYLA